MRNNIVVVRINNNYMCGITGKICFGNNSVSRQEILTMNEKIKHRGPDDGGFYISPDKKVGLGHRRLSIIDLSALGHQPMNYRDRYWIVFNGEIYNFQEKREMLIKNGYFFKSKTDTEVILALYDKYGKDCLTHLRGMFAFAIYDEKEKTVFCARDRVGKKPFKYYFNNDVFIFASELKAILTQKEYHKEPDYTAIHHYLTLQYCPAPLTGFKDIKKLEPAHYLFIDLKNGKIEKERYWKLDYSQKLDLSEEEWKKRIMEKLEESVKLRMISDVPLGAFLSGGIDSSAIIGIMSKFSDKPVKTFSIGFEEEKYNELPYARIIAKKFKTDHTEFIVKPDAIDILPMLVKQYEEPFADSSALPSYYLSQMTRKYVTVALNGDGGDENFGGYKRYVYYKLSLLIDRIISHKNISKLGLGRFFEKNKSDLFQKINTFLFYQSDNYAKRSTGYISCFRNDQKNEMYGEKFKGIFKDIDSLNIIAGKFSESGVNDKIDQNLYADIGTYLPDDLMTKVDMATMATSLESRSPFLDQEFLELTARIPSSLKIKGCSKKYIFKKSLNDLLPKEILSRRKKNFSVPINDWFKKKFQKFAIDKLTSEKFMKHEMFDLACIKSLLQKHTDTKTDYSSQIWTLLVLSLWLEEYFD